MSHGSYRAQQLLVVTLVAAVFCEKIDLQLEAVAGFPTPLFSAVGAVTVLALLRRAYLASHKHLSRITHSLAIWACLLALITLAAGVGGRFAPANLLAAAGSYLHFAFFVVVAYVLAVTIDIKTVEAAQETVANLAAFAAIIGVLQAIDQNVIHAGLSELLGLRSRVAAGFTRPVSIFSEPAYFGYFSLLGVAAAASLLGDGAAGLRRLRLGVSCVGVVLPFAVGPILLAAIWCFLLVVCSPVRSWRVVAATAVSGSIVWFSPIGPFLIGRLSRIMTARDPSGNVRIALNQASYKLISDNPFTGVGVGQSEFFYPHLVSVPGVHFVATNQAGNSYLAVASEQGIPLALLLFATILSVLIVPDRSPMARAFRVQTAVYLGSWFFVSSIGLPAFWVIFGVGLAALRAHRSNNSEIDSQ